MKYMAVAVAVAVSGGVAVPVAVPVAGLTKRFFNQKDFLINVWGCQACRTNSVLIPFTVLTAESFIKSIPFCRFRFDRFDAHFLLPI